MYGIPNIPNLAPSVTTSLLSFGGAALINMVFGNYWGVFDQSGFPLLLADNVTKVSYNNSSKLSQAPVENGSFAHYNKVASPYAITVQMTKGSGGVFERGAFLAIVEALAGSTDLYTIITPEAIYVDANIVGFDYSREATDGARLLKVNIHFEEVRQVTVQYTKTDISDTSTAQNAEAQNPANGGQVAPQTVPDSMAYKLASKIKTITF